jgi:hypothetical protein
VTRRRLAGAVALAVVAVAPLGGASVGTASGRPAVERSAPRHGGVHARRRARCHARRCRRRAARKPVRHSSTPNRPRPVTSTSTTTSSTTSGTSSPSLPGAPASPGAASPVITSTTTTSSASTAFPARVQITAREYSLSLSRASVPAGPVILELVNAGQDPHDLDATSGGAGALAGSFGLTAPGTHVDDEFTFAAGTYNLFCSLPGHAALGMTTTLTVTP